MGPLRHLAEWHSSSSWADRPAGSDTREWKGVQVPIQETTYKRAHASGTGHRPWALPSMDTYAAVSTSIMCVHACTLHSNAK